MGTFIIIFILVLFAFAFWMLFWTKDIRKKKPAYFPLKKPVIIDPFEGKEPDVLPAPVYKRKRTILENDSYRVRMWPFNLHVIFVPHKVHLPIDSLIFVKEGEVDQFIFEVVPRVSTTHELVDAGIRCYSVRIPRKSKEGFMSQDIEQEQEYICNILKKGKTIEYGDYRNSHN